MKNENRDQIFFIVRMRKSLWWSLRGVFSLSIVFPRKTEEQSIEQNQKNQRTLTFTQSFSLILFQF
jgi:hypothetical protein